MSTPCNTCNALCCQYFCFEIDKPESYDAFEDIRWYICHRDVSVHIDEDGDWYIQILNRCNKLGDDNRCTIYEDRPLICRNYGDNCEITGADYGYQAEFKTPEELDEYAVRTLGAKEYDKQMVRQRAEAEGVGRKEMRERLVKAKLLRAPSGKGGKKKGKSGKKDSKKRSK